MNKHLKLTVLALALAGTTLAGAANAFPFGKRGGGEQMTPPSFEELDTNGDGLVTADELEALSAARFTEMDTNGDGVISAEEMLASMQEKAQKRMSKGVERMIEKLDEDGDGALSADEMPQRDNTRMIGHLDEDDDGAVSAEEYEAGKEKREEMRGKDRKRGGDGGKGGQGGRG